MSGAAENADILSVADVVKDRWKVVSAALNSRASEEGRLSRGYSLKERKTSRFARRGRSAEAGSGRSTKCWIR